MKDEAKSKDQLIAELIELRQKIAEQNNVTDVHAAYQQAIVYAQELKDEIIERRRAEKALSASEERLRLVVNNVVDGIITIDEHGIIESLNPAAEKLFGYKAEEIIGQNIKILMTEEHAVKHDGYIARYIQTQQARIIGYPPSELPGKRKDGSTFIMDLAVSEFYLNERRMFIGLIRDITERKRLETQLRQVQKMEAVGQLSGGVAHDFNNILAIIIGQSELLLNNDPPLEEAIYQEIEQIKYAGERGSILTRQLLTFSRKRSLQPQLFNLNGVVKSIENMLRRVIRENINLITNLTPNSDQIKIGPGQIEQILMNLVVNARDAMPKGGKLTIHTEVVELKENRGYNLEISAGSYAMLSVTDTGIGMNEETKQRIFEPFFTTKARGKGTGLGLATVYGIVQNSKGGIDIESKPGCGATFKVYLPLTQEKEIKTAAPKKEVKSQLEGTETIMIVEDEANVRLVTRKFLQKRGYNVLEAGYAEEAIQVCQQHKNDIDLLITDVILPDINGPELSKQLTQSQPKLKTLYISGYSDDILSQHKIESSDSIFLEKPFSSKILAIKVRELLDDNS